MNDDTAPHEEAEHHEVKSFTNSPLTCTRYVQDGPYAVCVTTDPLFAIYIGTEHHVIGCDAQGNPVLKKIDTPAQ